MAKQITKNVGKVKPGIMTRMYFLLIRKIQKKGWNEADMEYWKKKDGLRISVLGGIECIIIN
ncbi:MAG: hypothetical protein K6G88_04430 [Lachnospiraceae bacterium]|nr:hypothetical protein [Lachnospiraceae bacterium]